MASLVARLGGLAVEALMELQYRFPLTPTPYCDVAHRLGVEPDRLVSTLRELSRLGVLKRVGFYLNYRSTGKVAALVAYSTGGDKRKLEALAAEYRSDPLATHVYLRDHPYYDVWVVVKRGSRGELERHTATLASRLGLDYVILYSRRTLKLSVKYDLLEGISRSGPYPAVHPSPPRPEELGYPASLARALRVLPLEARPYRRIAAAHGMSEDEVVEAARVMLEAGVLGDPGAALDGHRAGFPENGMVVMEPLSSGEEGLCSCAAGLPYSTHVVLRESVPPGAWRHTCYFMVHAVSREKLAEAVRHAESTCRPRSLMVIRSLADLKPGVVR